MIDLYKSFGVVNFVDLAFHHTYRISKTVAVQIPKISAQIIRVICSEKLSDPKKHIWHLTHLHTFLYRKQ